MRSGDCDCELAEGFSQKWLVWNGVFVKLDGQRGVMTRDILRNKFTTDCGGFFTAEFGGIPCCLDDDVRVVAF